MAYLNHPAVQKIVNLRDSLPANVAENLGVRETLLLEARKLMLSLEREDNVVERVCYQLWETAIIRVGVDIGLFKYLEEGKPKSNEDLAQLTKVDPLLLGRLLRCLASFGAVKQTGPDDFYSNTVAQTFAKPLNEAAIEGCFNFLSPGWLVTPDYLREKNYQNPSSGTDTAFAKAYNRPNGATLWEILASTPHMNAMHTYMSNFNEGHKDWTDFYPIEKNIVKGASTNPDDVLFVDVGGGQGHQAIKLKEKFPQLSGRFIVEELPNMITKDKSDGVEFLAHDFFKEQPIKGARVYYLRYITHDWSQENNEKIVRQLRDAMKPGYSRLIVHDWIVPAQGASKFMTAMDMNMMAISGGMERTEQLHREYIEKAGLNITGVWNPGDNISESVIEAQLP